MNDDEFENKLRLLVLKFDKTFQDIMGILEELKSLCYEGDSKPLES